jgi:hypothetical protein
LHAAPKEWHHLYPTNTVEVSLKPHLIFAEVLERKGTEEATAEARAVRDDIAQHLAEHEAKRAAALDETRAAAAEALRQWREERIKGKGEKKGGKGSTRKKSKRKGKKRGKAKGKGASSAAVIEAEQPREPAGGHAEGVAAVEGAAAAADEANRDDSHPREEAEETEECAICLQDLHLEDDTDTWCDGDGEGDALVVLKCGHRFHEICGDMWCAKCADKGWGVTCRGAEHRLL